MKQCKDLTLVSFNKAFRWIKAQHPTEAQPVYIPKFGGRSNLPFRAWCFADVLLLMANEQAVTQSQYILDKEKWEAFLNFVRENPEMKMGELAASFRRFGCLNKAFWPSIISISKACLEANQ